MIRLATWQWAVLAAPLGLVGIFLLIAAAFQIHTWHLSWIWAVIGLIFVSWRWLLAKWTQPAMREVDELVAEIAADLPETPLQSVDPLANSQAQQAEAALQEILQGAQSDPPVWVDWNPFWRRCLSLISAIAQIYNPEAKQPLLNIYVPQAYALLRGTMNDMDAWMQRMAPVLNQVTIEQALQAYEIYQKLQPAARRVIQAWGWARWLLNPVAAATNVATRGTRTKATQELLGNLNQLARETVLRNLAQQAMLLYSGQLADQLSSTAPVATTALSTAPSLPAAPPPSTTASARTQSVQDLLLQATPPATVAQQPVNLLLVGRTGAGKSSLINSLFIEPVAAVDVLPSTDHLQDYQWQATSGESMVVWDSPGYEQVGQPQMTELLLQQAEQVDVLLLVTPALDPALQMDIDFLQAVQTRVPNLPTIVTLTQVDRLRPLREWQPPYDWRMGDRAKEVSIRAAVEYRLQTLPQINHILPLVNASEQNASWGFDELSDTLLQVLDPAKQQRLARFLRSLEARTVAAVNLIDRYAFQMTTQQGIAVFLKSPVLQFISRLSTGSPALAIVLAEQIPIEQLPLVIGKAQLAYDLYHLLQPSVSFNFAAIWPLLINQNERPDQNARAFGYALIEYWAQALPPEDLLARFQQALEHQ